MVDKNMGLEKFFYNFDRKFFDLQVQLSLLSESYKKSQELGVRITQVSTNGATDFGIC